MQVVRRVLPALQSLSEDTDDAVRHAAIGGLAQLLCLHGSHKELTERVYSHLDELVTSNHPEVSIHAFGLEDQGNDLAYVWTCRHASFWARRPG